MNTFIKFMDLQVTPISQNNLDKEKIVRLMLSDFKTHKASVGKRMDILTNRIRN